VPLAVDTTKDITYALPRTKKIPAKVGIYLSKDIKRYIYKQQKLGMTFQMNVGEYIVPISKQMVSSMFEEVVFVDSLPPYKGVYKPDVEAVIEPEILYCYGNAIGTITGYIEAKVKMRITAYDLSGRVLWNDEAMGESRSKDLNLALTFLSGMEEVGKTGYQAAFSAASKIINDFNARPPKELYSLIEIKSLAILKNRKNISNFELFEKYYQRGQFQYEKKNYYQALYSFEKAEDINPDDLSTLFYVGVCYTYIGEKDKALGKFKRVIEQGPSSQEANDSRKWVDILKEPLKIGVAGFNKSDELGLKHRIIQQALKDSQMYEIIEVSDLNPPTKITAPAELNQFFDKCSKKGIRVVIFNDFEDASHKIKIEQQSSGDIASEYIVKITSKAYSTKKKELKSEVKINERTSTMIQKNKDEETVIKQELLKNASEKLVLRLLEHDIF
jgi:tetratricopeptide (TPR) repeat protein